MLRKALFLLFVLIATVTAQKSDTTVKKPANKVTMFIQAVNGTDPVKKGFYYRNPQVTCQLNRGKVYFSGKLDLSTADHIVDAFVSYRVTPQLKFQGGRLINWMRATDPPSETKVFILNPYTPFKTPHLTWAPVYNLGSRAKFFRALSPQRIRRLVTTTALWTQCFILNIAHRRLVTRGGGQFGKQPFM